jgi:hypothetical protein
LSDKLQLAVERAHRAKTILDDPLFEEAREHIESECFRLFQSVHPTDTDALQQIAGMRYLHTKYMAFMNRAVQDGKIAQLEIERKRKSLKDRIFG